MPEAKRSNFGPLRLEIPSRQRQKLPTAAHGTTQRQGLRDFGTPVAFSRGDFTTNRTLSISEVWHDEREKRLARTLPGVANETDGTKLLDLTEELIAALDERKSTVLLTPKWTGLSSMHAPNQSRCS